MSRAELLQICLELKLDHTGSIDEMRERIKNHIYKLLKRKYFKIGSSTLSKTALKFLTEECGFNLIDKKGIKYNYKGELL